MAGMNLYLVRCRGMQHSHGTAYVVAPDAETAYRTLRTALDGRKVGSGRERELLTVELRASEGDYPPCETALYLPTTEGRPECRLTIQATGRPAPTPREQGFQQRLTTVRDDALALTALLREAGIAFDYNHEALFADSLVYLLATVERLEAAEQAKAGRGERGAEPMMADAAAAPVPPSPPAAVDAAVVWYGLTPGQRATLATWFDGGTVRPDALDAALAALRTAVLPDEEGQG